MDGSKTTWFCPKTSWLRLIEPQGVQAYKLTLATFACYALNGLSPLEDKNANTSIEERKHIKVL